MAGVLNMAAQRINSSVAGLTGQASLPSQAPGAPRPASPVELIDQVPTEFGGLTHLFGGEAPIGSTQYAPVNPGLEIPAGSVVGRLGGLVPDVRSTTNNAVETAKAAAAPALNPMTVGIKNVWQKALRWVAPMFPQQPPNFPS